MTIIMAMILVVLMATSTAFANEALRFREIGPGNWLCDGQSREAGRWTADRAYMIKKARVYIGPDLYGTTEFMSLLYWWRIADATMIPVAMDWGERAGLTGSYGTSGSNATDRFIEGMTDLPVAPGDVFIVYASCISYFNNPVFQHPMSYVRTSGYLWLEPR